MKEEKKVELLTFEDSIRCKKCGSRNFSIRYNRAREKFVYLCSKCGSVWTSEKGDTLERKSS